MSEPCAPPPPPPPVPPVVAAAQGFLNWAYQDRMKPPYGEPPPPVEAMDPIEQRTYDAALEVLRNYFTGENDYAAPPPHVFQPVVGEAD